jgi:hypothetical protein
VNSIKSTEQDPVIIIAKLRHFTVISLFTNFKEDHPIISIVNFDLVYLIKRENHIYVPKFNSYAANVHSIINYMMGMTVQEEDWLSTVSKMPVYFKDSWTN